VSALESSLRNRLQETDSFAVAYGSLKTKFTSNKWLSASSANITATINQLKSATFISNIPTTILDGLDFAKKNGGANNVFWITAASGLDLQQSNFIIDELKKLTATPPITIVDYGDRNQQYFYYGNKNYYGNAYLYTNISSLTDGDFKISYSYQADIVFFQLFNSMLGTNTENIDLYTTLTEGYCHSKFNLSENSATTFSLREPIIQTGKFSGKFPFEIQLAGKIDGKLYKRKLSISESDIMTIDSTTRQYWAENHIVEKEYQYLNNKDIADLIKFSMKNRVLCRYTAFLALEPKIADPKPNGGTGGGSTSATTNLNEVNLLATAYPNPFRDEVKIDVEYDENSAETVVLEIYNMSSQQLYTSSTALNKGLASFSWIADNVPAGIYFAKIKIGKLQKVIKIVKVGS
jgi:Ca-activated chloride channel family protein